MWKNVFLPKSESEKAQEGTWKLRISADCFDCGNPPIVLYAALVSVSDIADNVDDPAAGTVYRTQEKVIKNAKGNPFAFLTAVIRN